MRQAIPLGAEDYVYAACNPFPFLPQIDKVWYAHQDRGQLEFRKYEESYDDYQGDEKEWKPYSKWMVTPCVYNDDDSHSYTEFEMEDVDVLKLWLQVVEKGGLVSDGVVNLFCKN